MSRLDLDALAGEPLIVLHAGVEYRLKFTADSLARLAEEHQTGAEVSQWKAFQAIIEAAGMPGEVFRELNIEQVTGLVETINKHLLPGTIAQTDRTVN